jgi:ubiquinone/menaquinone biosynthesis C-methylase UbiE
VTLDINRDFKPDIIGKAEEMPLPDNSFDGIICTQTLGDILYPDKAIKEFYRVLKTRGIVLLTEGFLNELHGEPRDFWRFTPYSLNSLFKENNFEVLKIEKIGGFFTVRAQMTMRHIINSLNLYQHQILGKIFSKLFQIYGKLAIFLDQLDKTKSNEKFALGYLILAKKC